MSGVFLSYRRDDSPKPVSRIYDRLVRQFGENRVYRDVDNIPLGVDFVQHITEALTTAAYVLVAIGPHWLAITDDHGRRRLDDPEDPVRFEVQTALSRKRKVVPMLVAGAKMPRRSEMPRDISNLVVHNGIVIRPEPDFDSDVEALMAGLHVDRIDESRLPTVFRVGLVARHLGFGGSVGWGLLGLIAALLPSDEPLMRVSFIAGGVASGWIGGTLVGWLTGLLIRHKSPPLVARNVRRMGVAWSIGLALAIVVPAGVGYLIFSQTEDFGTAILWILITFGVMVPGGLILGSGIAAVYFTRRLRLGTEQITRRRALAMGLVWLVGGVGTGVLFIGIASLASSAFGT